MIIGITGLRNVNIRQLKAQFYITIGGVKKGITLKRRDCDVLVKNSLSLFFERS